MANDGLTTGRYRVKFDWTWRGGYCWPKLFIPANNIVAVRAVEELAGRVLVQFGHDERRWFSIKEFLEHCEGT